MIKRLMTLLISLVFIANGSHIYGQEADPYIAYGEILRDIGMFAGTESGFELERASTRAEAAVMLVRLLGAEDAIDKEKVTHPFEDVPQWASPYVGYLYAQDLTQGISETNYGANQLITATEYTTFLLRALGYEDQAGDFDWQTSIEFAISIGLFTDVEGQNLLTNQDLLRNKMVMMSYHTLATPIKNQQISLFDYLYNMGVVTPEKYNQYDHLLSQYEMRGVWISYLDLQNSFKNRNEVSFRASVADMFEKIKADGLNTAIVQVRPFGDAIYPSEYFPWSYIVTGTEGKSPEYDPLEIIVEEGHKQGLKIEAWVNPYRIRSTGSKIGLSAENPASEWLEEGGNQVLQINEGMYYNPASQEVRALIIKGVLEIVNNYAVDGIHFDDYFYPSQELSYDKEDYDSYVVEGGKLTQPEWRRENVNTLIRSVYEGIKSANSSVQFGVSPRSDIQINYDELFIDIKEWVTHQGYLDYIAPQIYYGFQHDKYPYDKVVETWNELLKESQVKLYVGLAAYKIGREDQWAGAGSLEWLEENEILKHMVLTGRKYDHYKGFMLFRYDMIWKASDNIQRMADELDALSTLLH